jgi:hypothetical protein
MQFCLRLSQGEFVSSALPTSDISRSFCSEKSESSKRTTTIHTVQTSPISTDTQVDESQGDGSRLASPISPLDAYLLPGTTTFARDLSGKVKGYVCSSLERRLRHVVDSTAADNQDGSLPVDMLNQRRPTASHLPAGPRRASMRRLSVFSWKEATQSTPSLQSATNNADAASSSRASELSDVYEVQEHALLPCAPLELEAPTVPNPRLPTRRVFTIPRVCQINSHATADAADDHAAA